MSKIFLSIACFMDNDIVNTIEDCLNKAKYPDNIVFGICLQSEDDDKCLDKYKNNKQFKIKHINWSKARGPAYARGIIFDMFSNEDYFFQIDCHTRFYDNWDVKIINCFNECKKINDKAIISHYPVNINDIGKKDNIIVNISTVRCIDINMGIKTHGRFVNTSSCPKKSWGISAAMLFFDRKAYSDVPFDKDIYFGLQFEEQVVLAARYWTSGYDIFTPNTHIIATEYLTNRTRQKKSVPRIPNLQKETYDRLCHIMKLKCICKYDESTNSKLGNERTIEDYYKMLNIYDKIKETYPDNYLQDDVSNENVITVGSVGFGYEFGEYFVNYILNLAFPKFTIKYDNSENCDLIIYTHFTRDQDFWNKNEKPYLLWNGERYSLPSRMRNCSNKLVVNSLDSNSNLRIPYAFFAYVEYKQRNLWLKYKNLDIKNKRLFSYCISANRGSNIRNTFVENFSKKCNDVWCLGRYKVNNNIDKIDGKWNNEKLQETYSRYKFVLAPENEVKKGYITEKIINVFSSGAIPIYIGDSILAKKIFNSKAFICLDDFNNIDDCINYVLSLSDDKIKRYLSEKIFTDNPEADIFTEYNNFNADCNKDIISKIKILLENKEVNMYNTTLDKSILQSVIINLDKDKQKYENMSNKLNLFNIPYSRFNAILGTDIYDNFKSSGKIQNNGYTLRPHQVGIWQSHYKIWQYMIFNNIERLLIFEDDCSFVNDFKNLYHKTLELVKDEEYDILFLGYSGADIVINKDLHLLNHGIPRCTHAYVLTLSGAKKLVENMSIIDYPIDEIIGRMFSRKELKGYRTSYILVYQPWQAIGKHRNKSFPKELLHLIEEKSAKSRKPIDFKLMPKFYINLERRSDRNKYMIKYKNTFSYLSNLQRINACDGMSIKNIDDLPNNVTVANNQKINIINKLSVSGGMLSYGGLGCAISHKKILDLIIENNYEDTLILEDDIEIVDNFDTLFSLIEIPSDYDMFFIGYHSAPNSQNYNSKINKCHRIYGLFGLIISLQGAKKLVNEIKVFNPLRYALDTAYYHNLPSLKMNKYCLKSDKRLIHHMKQNTEENPSDIII